MEKLEKLLRFFHVDCRAAIEASVEASKKIDFLANVDTSATDSFYGASEKRLRRWWKQRLNITINW